MLRGQSSESSWSGSGESIRSRSEFMGMKVVGVEVVGRWSRSGGSWSGSRSSRGIC